MGFHIYTDHWWRDPKHAVTTEATIAEVKAPKRPTGTVTSGPYNPSTSGKFQEVVADVLDPATGRGVRAHGDLYFTFQPFQVGQRLQVRWSQKRAEINVFNENTAPEAEWSAVAATPAQAGPWSGAGVSQDQATRVQGALSALGLGSANVINVAGARPPQPPGNPQDALGQLERLAALRDSGALTDLEFADQKRRILGEA